MKINETIYGFKLKSQKKIDDISSTLYEFEHLKSGGTVVYLENEDTNCVFGIGVRTLPKDSTGVCHIIEHSVLCGSEKYPLKEPFVNLLKSSMNTFLNALTASDWTMYPVASQTPKDFDNLVAVYCDAVFAPISMKNPLPFLQEGWHLELLNEKDNPSYKGVVYNEMKGAMSGVERILAQATQTAMYKDNCYGFNSGGEPADIPNLSYEDYKAFYKEHYTPENSLTYFYGKLNIEEKLKTLDEQYFSRYERTGKKIMVVKQKPLINTDTQIEYAIGEDESEKDNTYMSLCYATCDYGDQKEFIAWQILLSSLLSSNDSPLKKALLEAKLGQDIKASYDDDNLQPALFISLEKTNPENKEKFREILLNATKDIISKGIDKKTLIANLNRMEFKTKEMDTGYMPKGLVLLFALQQNFNYYLDLADALSFQKTYDELRKEIQTDYFEKLLEKRILNSNHFVQVVAVPNKNLMKLRLEEMAKLMAEKKAAMSPKEIKDLVKQTKVLLAYQNRVDTKKELATLPSLSLRDIPSNIDLLDTKKLSVAGKKGILHHASSNKIDYLRLYFDAKVLKEEDLVYLNILLRMLRQVDTYKYKVEDLNNEIKTYLGNLSFSVIHFSKNKDDFNLYVSVSSSALNQNTPHMSELISEVIFHPRFTVKKLQQNLKQMVQGLRSNIIASGHMMALTKARSYFSKESYITNNYLSGVDYYKRLVKLEKEGDYKMIIKKMKEISALLFTKKNVIFSISSDETGIESLKQVVKDIKLPRREVKHQLEINLDNPKSDALAIPSAVNYNGAAFNLEELGLKHRGQYNVISRIVTYDNLWNEVRVKGGAYGVGLSFFTNNDVGLYSYRDPNVISTYDAYNRIAEYLTNFKASKKEFNNYIIGTMGGLNEPTSIPTLIDRCDGLYLSNRSKKDLIQIKKEALRTKISDIHEAGELFKKIMDASIKYSVGNKEKIEESKLFEDINTI